MRVLHDASGGWASDADYVELLRVRLSEHARVTVPRGRFILRPPRSVRKEVRRMVCASGFAWIGSARSDDERDWLIFRKLDV